VIVLAAGASSRMGRPKALLDFGGRSCLEVVLDACRGGSADDVVVVLGPDSPKVKEILRSRPGVRVVVNERPARGQTSSVKAGIAALPTRVTGFFVLPADHPLIEGADLAILMERFGERKDGKTIVIPAFEGRRGHPVLISASHREAILALADETPLRDYIHARESEVEIVPSAHSGVVTGMNTEKEYRAILAEYERSRSGAEGHDDSWSDGRDRR